jgi:hypothetical protein
MATGAALAAAYKPGGSGSSAWVVVLFAAVLVLVAIVSLVRFARRGPAVRWIPRPWRESVNRYYERHGWPLRNDADGNKLRGGG